MQADPKVVGRNIKALRKAFGEDQHDLGAYLGVGNTAVSNYEAGTRIRPELLERIAAHYGVSPSRLESESFDVTGYGDAQGYRQTASILTEYLFRFFAGSSAEGSEFRLACEECEHLMTDSSFSNGIEFWRAELERCQQVFARHTDGPLALEAMANYNSATVMYWVFLSDSDTQPYHDLLGKGAAPSDDQLVKLTLSANDTFRQNGTPNKDRFASDHEDLVFDNLCALRQDPAWADFAELCAALLYYCGFAMPELDRETKGVVGMYTLYTQARLGNELSLSCLGEFFDLPEA